MADRNTIYIVIYLDNKTELRRVYNQNGESEEHMKGRYDFMRQETNREVKLFKKTAAGRDIQLAPPRF